MTPDLLGGYLILAALISGTALIRWHATPMATGRHRSGDPQPPSVEACVETEAYCPSEDRPTVQLRLTLGGECCTGCRRCTPGGTQ